MRQEAPAPASGASSPAGREGDDDEYRLVDVLGILRRRRAVFALAVALSLLGTGAATYVAPREYTASARILVLEHPQVVQDWLLSRQVAVQVVEETGSRLYPVLLDGGGVLGAGWWESGPREVAADRLRDAVRVVPQPGLDARDPVAVKVSVTLRDDPRLARDVLDAYLRSLDALLPRLQNLTAAEAFPRHFRGDEQAAWSEAMATARARQYWIQFDAPVVPEEPSSPHTAANLAAGLVAGVLGGGVLALAVERLRGPLARG